MTQLGVLLGTLWPLVQAAPAALTCAPPAPFASIAQCTWECPDYRKGGPPQNLGTLTHVSRCSPQAGLVASYFHGTLTLAGRVERAETVTYGDVFVFIPDSKSSRTLPEPRQGHILWFANPKEARKLLAPPRLSARITCWTAPAKIVASGLLTDLGEHDGNHDWVSLRSVIEVGEYKNYGCSMDY